MPQKRYFSCSAVMISKCLTRVQKAWFQSVLHVYKKHDFKVSYMCTKSTISKCLIRVQKARFQSVLHVYKKHVHMYKMVHLQTSLGCNQCHCAQGRRKCLTASSQATGQRPAPSLQLSSVFQATQSSLSSPVPENKITYLPVFRQPVIPGVFITNALYGHDKGFHATRVTMAWAGSAVGEILHVCLSAHQVSIKSVRYGLQEAMWYNCLVIHKYVILSITLIKRNFDQGSQLSD